MKNETIPFAFIPVNGTFTGSFGERTLTYRKIDEFKAQVIHDPRAKNVGCVYTMPLRATFTTPPPTVRTRREALNLYKIGLEPAEVSLR